MKAINESTLTKSLDSGSTKRLKSFRKRLASDNKEIVFDGQVKDLVLKYAIKPESVREQIAYLNSVVDSDGVPFARSIKEYSKMEEVWKNFALEERPSFRWAKNFQSAEKDVIERYSRAHLQPLKYSSDEDIINGLTEVGTSSGWTSVMTGQSKKKDVLDDIYLTFQEKVTRAKVNGSFNSPMLPGVRTQCSGEYSETGEQTNTCKHKTRPIWMVDVYTVIAERQYAKPLTEWLSHYKYSAIGKDDFSLMARINQLRIRYENFISLDYSKFDSSIPSWLIRSAFKVIRSAFLDYDDELLQVLEEDFISKNLITANGMVYVNHGNPSGSGFTAIINGICNEIMTQTWAHFLNVHGKLDYIIMGDDNLIYINDKVSKSIVASYLYHNFGVKVNEDKTTTGHRGENPEFLSRIWTLDGAYRHPNILLSKLLFPEKFRNHHVTPPELVIYSYILGYPAGMKELIDVGLFLRDLRSQLKNLKLDKSMLKFMPYNVQLAYEQEKGGLPHITKYVA